LAYSFGSSNPWLIDPIASGAVVRQHILSGACDNKSETPHLMTKKQKDKERRAGIP
jgi:hypothetical protein